MIDLVWRKIKIKTKTSVEVVGSRWNDNRILSKWNPQKSVIFRLILSYHNCCKVLYWSRGFTVKRHGVWHHSDSKISTLCIAHYHHGCWFCNTSGRFWLTTALPFSIFSCPEPVDELDSSSSTTEIFSGFTETSICPSSLTFNTNPSADKTCLANRWQIFSVSRIDLQSLFLFSSSLQCLMDNSTMAEVLRNSPSRHSLRDVNSVMI